MTVEGLGVTRQRFHRDKALVDRLRGGDREAFDEFFESNAQGLVRWALKRLGGDLEAAQEVVQTTLCSAVAGIETYRGEASLFTWLCTCCHYEILRQRKVRARSPSSVELDEAILEDALPFRAIRTPEGDFRATELAERVHLTLDTLPGGHGEVLQWKYLDEISVEEIGKRLEITAKAAESRLSRARAAFKSRFRSMGVGADIWTALDGRQKPSKA